MKTGKKLLAVLLCFALVASFAVIATTQTSALDAVDNKGKISNVAIALSWVPFGSLFLALDDDCPEDVQIGAIICLFFPFLGGVITTILALDHNKTLKK